MADRKSNPVAVATALYLGGLIGALVLITGPYGMPKDRSIPDLFFLLLVCAHGFYGGVVMRSRRIAPRTVELLFGIAAVLFLFAYIYASNANMDYVQRYAEGKTHLNFGPDSRTERLNALLRYAPLLIADAIVLFSGIVRPRRFGIAAALISAFLFAISFPSFISLKGVGPAAFVAVVPLLVLLHRSTSTGNFVLYGTFFGVAEMMIANFWLGTFSLISLQLVTIAYAVIFALFFLVLRVLLRTRKNTDLLIIPLAWVAFDYLRSLGFIGYPWAMIGTSQYRFLPFIQIAAVTGVWGVTFLVMGVNVAVALLIVGLSKHKRRYSRNDLSSVLAVALVVLAAVCFGMLRVRAVERSLDGHSTAVVALVQQNTDPRKDDYRRTFDTLVELTDRALESDPDLVVWSETAFVPNIRRWSQENPRRYAYAALVRDFLEYQRSMGTWLLTGNDDYELVIGDSGEQERNEYNAAIFFDPNGTRTDAYRKIHLVPFTEHFPLKKRLPKAYELLKTFDVKIWEPGDKRVVFEHPLFAFSTPICFEDSFPNDVRLFAKAGADLIINLSNDYWSLTEVEAQQHFANALFRAIENRRTLLRAAASGVTTHITPAGRKISSLPNYEEGVLVVEVSFENPGVSPYLRFGDWFPILCTFLVVVIGSIRVACRFRRRGASRA